MSWRSFTVLAGIIDKSNQEKFVIVYGRAACARQMNSKLFCYDRIISSYRIS